MYMPGVKIPGETLSSGSVAEKKERFPFPPLYPGTQTTRQSPGFVLRYYWATKKPICLIPPIVYVYDDDFSFYTFKLSRKKKDAGLVYSMEGFPTH